jgi:hypothetical protein
VPLLPPHRAHASWLHITGTTWPSNLQTSVAQVLQEQLGLQPRMEQRTHDLLFSIDIVLDIKGRQVAIEVDGPDHYSRNAVQGAAAREARSGVQLVQWPEPEAARSAAAAATAFALVVGRQQAGAAVGKRLEVLQAGSSRAQHLVLAPTLARRACLRQRGWELAVVPHYEWSVLRCAEHKAQYLRLLLGLQ